MLIVNTPICPKCHMTIMSRSFSTFDYVGMVAFLLIFFPIAIWLYLNPRYLFCRNCGNTLAELPPLGPQDGL